jgi:hypothetical protein
MVLQIRATDQYIHRSLESSSNMNVVVLIHGVLSICWVVSCKHCWVHTSVGRFLGSKNNRGFWFLVLTNFKGLVPIQFLFFSLRNWNLVSRFCLGWFQVSVLELSFRLDQFWILVYNLWFWVIFGLGPNYAKQAKNLENFKFDIHISEK